ncbi:hypothetical protein HMPREF0083_00514 [Aneurinibacillus aneurinilyticus ATCC 12856]|uniref:Uncharacterized protein n=1 Tax=Aneurinibacillus aneurinilyticus ATCC 12856 TaxID=649747 RepID=U1X8T6_ANEAE|nr:hypothetical protein HMPREF0083_00514 [Aneurinibacillus aneurinilyticus ATCC 12856]
MISTTSLINRECSLFLKSIPLQVYSNSLHKHRLFLLYLQSSYLHRKSRFPVR